MAYCCLCGKPQPFAFSSPLTQCAQCRRHYHTDCHIPSITGRVQQTWLCSRCSSDHFKAAETEHPPRKRQKNNLSSNRHRKEHSKSVPTSPYSKNLSSLGQSFPSSFAAAQPLLAKSHADLPSSHSLERRKRRQATKEEPSAYQSASLNAPVTTRKPRSSFLTLSRNVSPPPSRSKPLPARLQEDFQPREKFELPEPGRESNGGKYRHVRVDQGKSANELSNSTNARIDTIENNNKSGKTSSASQAQSVHGNNNESDMSNNSLVTDVIVPESPKRGRRNPPAYKIDGTAYQVKFQEAFQMYQASQTLSQSKETVPTLPPNSLRSPSKISSRKLSMPVLAPESDIHGFEVQSTTTIPPEVAEKVKQSSESNSPVASYRFSTALQKAQGENKASRLKNSGLQVEIQRCHLQHTQECESLSEEKNELVTALDKSKNHASTRTLHLEEENKRLKSALHDSFEMSNNLEKHIERITQIGKVGIMPVKEKVQKNQHQASPHVASLESTGLAIRDTNTLEHSIAQENNAVEAKIEILRVKVSERDAIIKKLRLNNAKRDSKAIHINADQVKFSALVVENLSLKTEIEKLKQIAENTNKKASCNRIAHTDLLSGIPFSTASFYAKDKRKPIQARRSMKETHGEGRLAYVRDERGQFIHVEGLKWAPQKLPERHSRANRLVSTREMQSTRKQVSRSSKRANISWPDDDDAEIDPDYGSLLKMDYEDQKLLDREPFSETSSDDSLLENDEFSARTEARQPKKRPQLDPDWSQRSFERIFDIPKMVTPTLFENKLAFRTGQKDSRGRIPRRTTIFKVGRNVPGELR